MSYYCNKREKQFSEYKKEALVSGRLGVDSGRELASACPTLQPPGCRKGVEHWS